MSDTNTQKLQTRWELNSGTPAGGGTQWNDIMAILPRDMRLVYDSDEGWIIKFERLTKSDIEQLIEQLKRGGRYE